MEDQLVDYDERFDAEVAAANSLIPEKELSMDCGERRSFSEFAIHAMSFKDFLLKAELNKAIADSGFENPSEVQQKCIPQAILGSDVLCQAKSGSGKTLVFVISILHQLEIAEEGKSPHIQVLTLCHTHELAHQILGEFRRLSKHLPGLNAEVFYGGQPKQENVAILRKAPPQILVGTPGRILHLLKDRELDLSHVSHFILDECDRVLEQADMRKDVQQIFRATPVNKQVLMFTATLSKEIRETCKKFMYKPLEVLVDHEQKLILGKLKQFYLEVEETEKNRTLVKLLDDIDFNQVIIFVKSTLRAEALSNLLNENNFPAICVHSALKSDDRIRQFDAFRRFEKRIMVTTELLGRGVDFDRVNFVVNYDMPSDSTAYLHRIARAGRFGTIGLAISFVKRSEEQELFDMIQNRFAFRMTQLPTNADDFVQATSLLE